MIDHYCPETIAETGTWNGSRAIEMCNCALKKRSRVRYLGFDLFENATAASDAREFNVKKHYSWKEVNERLSEFQSVNPGFRYELKKGDTRDTLVFPTKVDFAFIDGGHSVATISHDLNMLSGSRVIVVDDYYTDGPDTKKFGCNEVIECEFTVLPWRDRVKGGGFVQMALIVNDPEIVQRPPVFALVEKIQST